jgi:hypothetical protein
LAGDGDTTVGDLVGEYTQKPDGTYEFIYGPLIRAMQEGRVLFIDDATLISPGTRAPSTPTANQRITDALSTKDTQPEPGTRKTATAKRQLERRRSKATKARIGA